MSDFVPPNLPMGDEPDDLLSGSDDSVGSAGPPAPLVPPVAPSTPPPRFRASMSTGKTPAPRASAPVPKPTSAPRSQPAPVASEDVPAPKNQPNAEPVSGGVKVLGGKVVDAPSALDAGLMKAKRPSAQPVPQETQTVPTDALAPGTPASQPAPLQESFIMRHKLLVGLVLFLLLASIVLGGLSLFLRDSVEVEERLADKLKPTIEQPVDEVEVPVDPVVEPDTDIVLPDEKIIEPEKSPEESVEELINDPDGDGLTTTKELLAGTDPNRSDTDDDGLTDKEELNIWKTDPLDADTDDDTFADGDEVRHGFNPLGDGRLFDVPQ